MALEDLMTDKDTIDLCYLKVFLVGPPGVGKTTTLNRLLNKFENIYSAGGKANYLSTLLANCIQVLALISDNADEWLSSEDIDEETKFLFGYLYGNIPSRKVNIKPQSALPAESSKVVKVPKQHPLTPTHTEHQFDLKSQHDPSIDTQHEATPSRLKRLMHIKTRLRNLIATGDYSKMTRLLGNTLLNINDIGGQPGFLEMLPALSAGPALYLVFLDLSKDIDKPYKIPFSRDNTIIAPYDAMHTVETMISQILSAILSVHHTSQNAVSYPKATEEFRKHFEQFQQNRPVSVLIGTHKDKLDNPEVKINQISKTLKKIVMRFNEIMVSRDGPCFFPVDNYFGTEESEILPLRKFMSNAFKVHFNRSSLPIRPKWLIFGVLLRREYKIIKIDDCLELGTMLDMDEEEVRFCLWYLDCIGTLMYYTNIANDENDWFRKHVICTPQVIFDSISQLIIVSLRTLHSEDHVIECDKAELIKKGQFSLESIEKYCLCEEVTEKLKKDELIPANQLVTLLNHVNLLSPIIHKEAGGERITYLMPAVLECASPDELTAPLSPKDNHPESLFITFKRGYIPTGSFCGLITKLVSLGPIGILGLEWVVVEDGVKRNCVSFYVEFMNKVTLICHDRYYEVRIAENDPDFDLHYLCTHVLSVILFTLKSLYRDLAPEIAFQCPCPKHMYAASNNCSNLCILVESKVSVKFICTERQRILLRNTQQVWLGKVNFYTCIETINFSTYFLYSM